MNTMVMWEDCTPAEKVERWQQALRVLEGLDEHARVKHFDMSDWARVTKCGTVCCVAGHCAHDQWFIDRGYRLEQTRGGAFFPAFGYETHWPMTANALFFGTEGAASILHNCVPRSIDVVINEIKEHIEWLRNTP